MMIEDQIKKFCADDHDAYVKPFRYQESILATDRRVVIIVPIWKIDLTKLETGTPPFNVADFLNGMNEKIAKNPVGYSIDVRENLILLDKIRTETIYLEIECEDCAGIGTHTCDLGYQHECGTCEGYGQIAAGEPIDKIAPEDMSVKICGEFFNPDYIYNCLRAAEIDGAKSVRIVLLPDYETFTPLVMRTADEPDNPGGIWFYVMPRGERDNYIEIELKNPEVKK